MENQQTQLTFQQSVQVLFKLIKLPFICQNCGNIETMKNLQNILNSLQEIDINELSIKLTSTAHQIAKRRNESLDKKKLELQKSLDQLQSLKIDDVAIFNVQNSSQCLSRVCDDMFYNVYEQIEIQNSLDELVSIMQEQQLQINQFPQAKNLQLLSELQSNKIIKERLEGALKINQSHKEILKEILMKIGQENNNEKIEYEIQIKTLQLTLIDLAQANSDFNQRIIELEQLLTDKDAQLLKYNSQLELIEQRLSNQESQSRSSIDKVQCYEIKNVVSQKISQQEIVNQSHTSQSEQFYSIIDQSLNDLEINCSQGSQNGKRHALETINQNIIQQSFAKQKTSEKKVNVSFEYGNPLESESSFCAEDQQNQLYSFF